MIADIKFLFYPMTLDYDVIVDQSDKSIMFSRHNFDPITALVLFNWAIGPEYWVMIQPIAFQVVSVCVA